MATIQGLPSNDAQTAIRVEGLSGGVAASVTSTQLPAALGATTTANSLSVTTPTDQSFGHALTITRPANATPYTALDVVGGALTFTLAKGAGQYMITSASLEYDVAALPANMANMRVHLYSVTPPSAVADNGAWDLATAGDRASYLGFFDLGTLVDHGSTLYVEVNGINKQITTASANVFAYLETIIGWTPAGNSEVLVLTLHTVQV